MATGNALVPPGSTRDDDLAILVARVNARPSDPAVHRLPFEAEAESAALTRGFIAVVLQGAGWGAQVDTAALLVSELVTNVVCHARGPCALVVTFGDDAVEVSVEDGDLRMPAARLADALDPDGRGLLLLGALAQDWGVRLLPEGKAIWFLLGRDDSRE